jgi:hypothetical protein
VKLSHTAKLALLMYVNKSMSATNLMDLPAISRMMQNPTLRRKMNNFIRYHRRQHRIRMWEESQ